jgi:proline iminopeptidase
MAAGLGLMLGASGAAAAQTGARTTARTTVKPLGRLIPVRGARLYVEDSGPRDAPALVYLHGGPGVGSYEFSHYAGALLARRWRLIVFDQRGVLRSDPLGKDEAYGMADLVADTDALREALGIARWTVLGHSFGGHYALRYALAHPERVERLALENPALSFPDSSRSLMEATARLYTRLGKPDLARQAAALATSDLQGMALLDATQKAMGGLGPDRQSLYLYDQKWRGFFDRLSAASGLSDAQWTQGQVQAGKLFEDGQLLEPMLARVQDWKGPTLLLKGQTDHATSEAEIAAVTALARGRVVTIPRSGHFSHVEQPALLAAALDREA